MRLLELHILQSFPFTCLNRDDNGSPKTCFFGGVERARVSSQCWKRAIRDRAREISPELFAGRRSCLQGGELSKILRERGYSNGDVDELANRVISSFTSKSNDSKEDAKSVLLYLSPLELSSIADVIMTYYVDDAFYEEAKKAKKNKDETKPDKTTLSSAFLKAAKKAIGGPTLSDAFDICAFGRMTAADASVTLEGASMFSHAISTHRVNTEIDYFTALDDLKSKEELGAGHLGTLLANSACYYRDVHLNLDLLFKDDHFGLATDTEKRAGLKTFIQATLEAVPSARKNSMFGASLPEYALGVVRTGSPLSFSNAFEKPVEPEREGGYIGRSKSRLEEYYKSVKTKYDAAFSNAKEFCLNERNPMSQWLTAIVDACMEQSE